MAHAWLGAHFPTERGALFYVPLGALVIVGTLDWIIGAAGTKVGWALQTIGVLLAAVLVAHFLRAANTRHTSEWVYDAETRTAMDDLERYVADSHRRPSPIRLGMNWVFEPTVNFYRATRHYDWLLPAYRLGVSRNDDFILVVETDLRHIPVSIIERYPVSGAVLAKTAR